MAKLLERGRNILGVAKLCWRASPWMSIVAPLLTIASGIVPAVLCVISKRIIDSVVKGVAEGPASDSAKALIWYLLLLLAVRILSDIAREARRSIEQLFQRRLTGYMQEQINRKALSLDLAYFESPVFFDRFQRAQQEVGYRPRAVFTSVLSLGQQVVTIVSCFYILATYSIWLVPATFVVVLPIFCFQAYFGKVRFAMLFRRTADERRMSYLQRLMTNNEEAKEVRIFGLGRYLLDNWKSLFWHFYSQDRRVTLRVALAMTGAMVVQTTAGMGFFGLVLYNAVAGTISIGTAFMLFQAMDQCLGTMGFAGQGLGTLYESSLFLSNLWEFFQQQPILQEPAEPVSLSGPVRGRLQLENVTFSYPGTDRVVLRNVSFTIDPGMRVALVGENGAGKTTLVKLLARLYDPQHGTVSVDGIDLRGICSSEWQSHLAVIFQDFIRYKLTVRENIGFGDLTNMSDQQRLEVAAQEAGAAGMIRDLPNGWDSILSRMFEGGSELSLGQWQRVALARALFSPAEIVILDEPTASLDAKQEYDLFQRFEKLTRDKTTVLISHRLSSARLVDRIFFFEAGEVVEVGSHEQLMQTNGQYAAMFKRQAANYTQRGGAFSATLFPL